MSTLDWKSALGMESTCTESALGTLCKHTHAHTHTHTFYFTRIIFNGRLFVPKVGHVETTSYITSNVVNLKSISILSLIIPIIAILNPITYSYSVDEKNRYLRHVCLELQDELNTLREERLALQCKLEKLHLRSPVHPVT